MKITGKILVFWLALVLGSIASAQESIMIEQPVGSGAKDIEFYKNRYHLSDVYTKLVNNVGDGFIDLYGVRNFRVILNGIAYRGGANNYYHKTHKRDNRNPLPNDGLLNLCEEGFSKAVYLYSTNFETAPKNTACKDVFNKQNILNYVQWSPYNTTDVRKLFAEVMSTINDASKGPVYIHCWNGWHASGLASALILRQFCGTSAAQAVKYWDQNTDGNNTDPAYESIRKTIRDFKPYEEFKVDVGIQKEICPKI